MVNYHPTMQHFLSDIFFRDQAEMKLTGRQHPAYHG